jgi:hypothetical protein
LFELGLFGHDDGLLERYYANAHSAVLVVLCLLGGCDEPSTPAPPRCIPGTQINCACIGATGVQRCLQTGAFGPCECALPPRPPGAPPSPQGSDTADQPVGVRERVEALRARTWMPSRSTAPPTVLYAHLSLSGGTQRHGSFTWRPTSGPVVELRVRVLEGEWDTGLDQMDGRSVELRIRVLGRYPGTSGEGERLVQERHALPPSARIEMSDFYVRVAQREDGHALLAFDSHGLDMDTDRAVPQPEHTRRLLFVWDRDVAQPIAVADWRGAPREAPLWARFTQ